MTISSTTVKNSYSGNGTLDTFNYTFKIFADTDLQVIIRDATATETVKTLTTHYTVTGAGSASGGTIVFTAGNIPTATETVVIRRAVPQTQAIDYIANDPFPAESHEEGLDRATMTLQQLQEEVDRSIKLSRTNTMTSTEFAVGSTNRANKILAFDSSGEISVTQELGTFVGNWSSSTDFNARDIVKDTTNNNIYIANTAHTSSGSLPISSNTDVAKWDLLVDAASATSSATAAASSATAAAASATAAATSATNAATSETNAATSESNASTSETNAASSATSAASSATSASTSATTATTKASEASTSATNAATSETNAASSATSAASSATTATTKASEASTSATNAATSETNAASSASAASTSETNAATSATTASNAATAAQAAQTAAELAADNFDDTYLGAKASDPTVDNDGDPLTSGDLYFNTSSNEIKYYDGTSWSAISPGITDIVSDTTPQLGGNLDVNSNSIVSVSNGNISITPDGTGKVIIDGLSHPTADGSADQVLKTDGAGNLSFGDVSGGTSWQSSIVTGTTLSAVAGNGYWIDTTSNACTVTLPASASVGDTIEFVDYARNWGTNNLTINPNSLNFQGNSSPNPVYDVDGQSVRIVYSGATQGWIPTTDDDVSLETPQTITTDFLVIGGGGSGGQDTGGGGGAGGYRNSYSTESSGGGGSSETTLQLSPGETYTITIGGGGATTTSPQRPGNAGTASSISGTGITTITSAGGGLGAASSGNAGGAGGSGGGAAPNGSGGSGTANQGFNGENGTSPAAGGGGGALEAGGTDGGGLGGDGLASSITGTPVTRAGGGGGANPARVPNNTPGGDGGGGTAPNPTGDGTAGTANTGSGGGGGGLSSPRNGGAGGSGVVILRLPTADYTGTTTGSPTVDTDGTDTILTYTGSGSYTA